MKNDLIEHIKNTSKEFFPAIINIRRELHKYPELSFQESATAERIKNFLEALKIPHTGGWAGNGIVATIKGDANGSSIMLRADMDALPIQEETQLPFASANKGVMHACGHDVHTSSLLGTAAILQQLKSKLHGEVKIIFQPGEEKLPGGASLMIKEGLLEEKPQCIIAQHVYPALPAGHVGFRTGLYMASADEVYITIHGKGGHAATPHMCIDPITIAARIISGLQEIISRQKDPISTGVLTIGKINSSGGASNVIPERVVLEGTLRAMDEQWRFEAHEMIRHFVDHTAKASGGSAETRIEIGYPSLVNDETVTAICRDAAIQYLGTDKVHDLPQRMSSEDFAFYTQQVPGTFYRLGTGWPEPERNYPVHSNKFNIDESSLETGMGLMAYMILSGTF